MRHSLTDKLYGLMALEREMSIPPALQWSMAHFTFTFLHLLLFHG